MVADESLSFAILNYSSLSLRAATKLFFQDFVLCLEFLSLKLQISLAPLLLDNLVRRNLVQVVLNEFDVVLVFC